MSTISGRSIGSSLLCLLIAAILLAGELAAHPHGQSYLTGRRTAQNRVPMRVNRPPRVAPDNQTKPLEVGTAPEIDPGEQVMLEVTVLDADSGQLLPHRVHIDDADGNYYPPEGHFDIEPANWNTNNVSYEPDTIKDVSFDRSRWLAVRARHDRPNPDNWHHTIAAAHSSPIYVTVNDELPAVRESAEYMVTRLNATLQWAETQALWSSDEYKRKAMSSFRQAKKFYESARARAK